MGHIIISDFLYNNIFYLIYKFFEFMISFVILNFDFNTLKLSQVVSSQSYWNILLT